MTDRTLAGQLAAGQRQRFVNWLGDAAGLHIRFLARWILLRRLCFLSAYFHFLSALVAANRCVCLQRQHRNFMDPTHARLLRM